MDDTVEVWLGVLFLGLEEVDLSAIGILRHNTGKTGVHGFRSHKLDSVLFTPAHDFINVSDNKTDLHTPTGMGFERTELIFFHHLVDR